MPDPIKKPKAIDSKAVVPKLQNRYSAIIAKVFSNHYGKKGESFEFTRMNSQASPPSWASNCPKTWVT